MLGLSFDYGEIGVIRVELFSLGEMRSGFFPAHKYSPIFVREIGEMPPCAIVVITSFKFDHVIAVRVTYEIYDSGVYNILRSYGEMDIPEVSAYLEAHFPE